MEALPSHNGRRPAWVARERGVLSGTALFLNASHAVSDRAGELNASDRSEMRGLRYARTRQRGRSIRPFEVRLAPDATQKRRGGRRAGLALPGAAAENDRLAALYQPIEKVLHGVDLPMPAGP